MTEFVGVYDADGTVRGELAYWVGARFGVRHCSLCELTHGTFREREDWRVCRSELPVPFHTYHRDDQPADVRAAAVGAYPIVVARTAAGVVSLLGPAELERCNGDLVRFVDALLGAVTQAGLLLPE